VTEVGFVAGCLYIVFLKYWNSNPEEPSGMATSPDVQGGVRVELSNY